MSDRKIDAAVAAFKRDEWPPARFLSCAMHDHDPQRQGGPPRSTRTRVYIDSVGDDPRRVDDPADKSYSQRLARSLGQDVWDSARIQTGLALDNPKWMWKAGCDCGCSPGFVCSSYSLKDVWVTVRYGPDLTPEQQKAHDALLERKRLEGDFAAAMWRHAEALKVVMESRKGVQRLEMKLAVAAEEVEKARRALEGGGR